MPVAATTTTAGSAMNWLMRELQAMDVGQVAGAQLDRDREHHRLGEGRPEAEHDRGDVEEEGEVVVGDGEVHVGAPFVDSTWPGTYPGRAGSQRATGDGDSRGLPETRYTKSGDYNIAYQVVGGR